MKQRIIHAFQYHKIKMTISHLQFIMQAHVLLQNLFDVVKSTKDKHH